MTSEPGQLAGTMSGSVILPYLGSLMAVPCGAIKGHMDILLSLGLGFV